MSEKNNSNFLFFNFLIFFYGYLEGFFKPYWLDEVLTISLLKY